MYEGDSRTISPKSIAGAPGRRTSAIYDAVAAHDLAAAEAAIAAHFDVGSDRASKQISGWPEIRGTRRKTKCEATTSALAASALREASGPMLRFDTVIGDIPYLLLGIPLTLANHIHCFHRRHRSGAYPSPSSVIAVHGF